MRVLAIVPARGGSKGVPRKNVRLLGGRPLVEWTARAALDARRVDRAVLSTDDEEIAAVARRCGLEVPFMRPPELAGDETPMLPVLQHAVRALEGRGDRFDLVCLLQPTAPFRSAGDIDASVELFERTGADSVASFRPVPPEHNPHWVYFRRPDGTMALSTGEAQPVPRRQELPPAFCRDGAIFLVRRALVLDRGTLYGDRLVPYLIDPARSIDIDTEADWAEAEALLTRLPR